MTIYETVCHSVVATAEIYLKSVSLAFKGPGTLTPSFEWISVISEAVAVFKVFFGKKE